jgi:hypothetical protein
MTLVTAQMSVSLDGYYAGHSRIVRRAKVARERNVSLPSHPVMGEVTHSPHPDGPCWREPIIGGVRQPLKLAVEHVPLEGLSDSS